MGNLICTKKEINNVGSDLEDEDEEQSTRVVPGPKNIVDGPIPVADGMASLVTSDDGDAPVQIDVWSDLACPWCYVGKLRLDRAVKRMETAAGRKLVHIKWHPYIIDLATCSAGEEYRAYNIRRWGSDAWTIALRKAGAKDGARFKNWQYWPNSVNGHRLVHFADSVGKGAEAKQMLLNMTYEEGENISDLDVLCGAAELLGLPKNARDYLDSNEGRDYVLEQDVLAKERGMQAVPFFIFNGKLMCSGARETESFEAMIKKTLDSLKPRKGYENLKI